MRGLRLLRLVAGVPAMALTIAAVAASGTGVVVTRTAGSDRPDRPAIRMQRIGPVVATVSQQDLARIDAPLDASALGGTDELVADRSPAGEAAVVAPSGVVDAVPGAAPLTVPGVAPLTALTSPDVLVLTKAPVTPAQLDALRRAGHPAGLTVMAAGTVQVAGGPALALGVDPSEFRAFTPQVTAESDGVWQVVGRGELVGSYELQKQRGLVLGATVPVTGGTTVPMRVGGVASLGLPGVGAIMTRDRAAALGLAPGTAVLLSAAGREAAQLKRAAVQAFGADADVQVLAGSVAVPAPTKYRGKGKPRSYRELYQAAATTCRGLSWQVLAAIGQIESDHGRNAGVSSAGAMGPMQFLPSTFAVYGVDGDGDNVADINNPFDSVYSAARYLCAGGAGRGGQSLYDAIFAYNHADWYVRAVLALAPQYR